MPTSRESTPEGAADAHLVLLPKTDKPSKITQFRPISPCNVSYKIVIKVIANKFKAMRKDIISPNQASFIQGRQNIDNVLIYQEVEHSLKQRKGVKGAMILKLDLKKAYDHMEWAFILDSLKVAGIPMELINPIMSCISSGFWKLLWNGEERDAFKPTRGLRQVEPLSTFLFVLCMERLSHWINSRVDVGLWKRLKMSRRSPIISHLLFVDDILFFDEAGHR